MLSLGRDVLLSPALLLAVFCAVIGCVLYGVGRPVELCAVIGCFPPGEHPGEAASGLLEEELLARRPLLVRQGGQVCCKMDIMSSHSESFIDPSGDRHRYHCSAQGPLLRI